MNGVIEWLNQFDWQNIGSIAILIITNIIAVIVFFKKNIVNISKLKLDNSTISESIKYSKGNIKSNVELINELGRFKVTVKQLTTEIKELRGLVYDLKNNVNEIKSGYVPEDKE